jgi:Domain of unknown function (DUF4331)
MKTNKLALLAIIAFFGITSTSCNNDDDAQQTQIDFSGTYSQKDQFGRPAINTVFVGTSMKDNFNVTTPSTMGATYQSIFQTRLLALNSGYTTNALGQDAAALTGLLATDVMNVSTTGTTTFFDGTNVLTGRKLADDVIDVELLLLFGGPAGTSNTNLTSDHVDANDKPFLTSFPYLASAW